jgi:hypothetical protein
MSLGHILAIPVIAYILIPMPKRIRYVAAALLVGGLYLLLWPITYKNYRLEREGQHTTGILINKSCEIRNSQIFFYKFVVDGKEFTGKGAPGKGNQSCERIQNGDQVFVTYLPGDPYVSSAERAVDSDIILGVFFTLGLLAGLIWINGAQTQFWTEKRARKRKNA